jgi:hypothetical protein
VLAVPEIVSWDNLLGCDGAAGFAGGFEFVAGKPFDGLGLLAG